VQERNKDRIEGAGKVWVQERVTAGDTGVGEEGGGTSTRE
jgi:hypothetical protein